MSRSETVWIVDDDRSIRWVLEKALQQEGMTTQSFDSADGVLSRLVRQQPDVIISDIRMPGSSGLELLARIRELHPRLPVIIMTAHSDLDSAVASYQGGAFEYLPKPFDVDEAVSLVKRANMHAQEQQGLAAPVELARTPEIIGEAPAMQEVFRAIGRLSHSNITVLINGESGTGKELVAHALHRHSPRAASPFIALNMAAIPPLRTDQRGCRRADGSTPLARSGVGSARRGPCRRRGRVSRPGRSAPTWLPGPSWPRGRPPQWTARHRR
jgi:two-component system nitrogen regulation response regulator GlnG